MPLESFFNTMSSLFLVTWIHCSPNPPLREVHAIPGGSVSIISYYDVDQYGTVAPSLCRQVSRTECIDVTEPNWMNQNSHHRQVTTSQNVDNNLTSHMLNMTQLQHADTGLYKWRIWTGVHFAIIQDVLLVVVEEVTPSLKVIHAESGETAEMHCSYSQKQRWSKIWCKQIGVKCEWVAHSDGNTNRDYERRPMLSDNQKSRTMIMKLTQLELWDNGVYQCQESGGETILHKILLIVTQKKTKNNDGNKKTEISTISQPTYVAPGQGTVVPRTIRRQLGVWDVLRWFVLLIMVLCLLFFCYYERFLGIQLHKTRVLPGNNNLHFVMEQQSVEL